MKTPSTVSLWAVALSALLATGCWDFNGAYDHYCSALNCDGGPGGGSGGGTGGGSGGGTGGGSGGGSGGGTGGGAVGGGSGGGGMDAGMDAGCGVFGAQCSGVDQCCPTVDGGYFGFYTGFPMGCSKLDLCQLIPPAGDGGYCLPQGYACHDGTECCNGSCNGGRCETCGNVGDVCSDVYGCCFNQYYVGCDLNTGRCVDTRRPDGGNACLSSDMCNDDDPFNDATDVTYCEFDGGVAGDLGVCLPTFGQCTEPGSAQPTGAKPCCPGTRTGGQYGCCIEDGAHCAENQYSCCSGKCQAGLCVPNTTPDPGIGEHCLYFQSCGGTSGSFWCDEISETCGKTFCFQTPTGPGQTGCCSWTDKFGICTFPDHSTCTMFGNNCTQNSDCCSNSCTTWSDGMKYCEYPPYY